MRGGDEIGHVDDDVGVCTGVVDVPLGVVVVGGVAAICFKKDGVAELKGFELGFFFALDGANLLVVGVEGRVVHEPLQAAVRVSSVGAVVPKLDVEIYRIGGKVCGVLSCERV